MHHITKSLSEEIYHVIAAGNKPADIQTVVDKILAEHESGGISLGLYIYRMAYSGETSYYIAEYPFFKLRAGINGSQYPSKGIITAAVDLNAVNEFIYLVDVAKELGIDEDHWYWLSIRLSELKDVFVKKGSLKVGVKSEGEKILKLPTGFKLGRGTSSAQLSALTRGLKPIRLKPKQEPKKIPKKIFKPNNAPAEVTQKLHEANIEAILTQHLDTLEEGLQLLERQFVCPGVGRIDLLCKDRKSNLVVIELKGFATKQDSIIDQITRYMGWVKQHFAKRNQKVRGFIVAPRADERLGYAVEAIPGVEIKTFSIAIK